MREIIFRGKRTDNGEWIKGAPFFAANCCKMICAVAVHPDFVDEGNVYYSEGFPVDPDTVGQYTGLKDKNGRRIFEGDILKIAKKTDGLGYYHHPPLAYPVNVVVKWDMCGWMWETLCDDKYYITFPDAWCHYECEIIGNIHDAEAANEAE